MTPDIVTHQSSVEKYFAHVWNWDEELLNFIEKFLENPDILHVYDWGTEHTPVLGEISKIASQSGHRIQNVADRCQKLFSDRPEVKKNLRGISGCYRSGPYDNHWHNNLKLRNLMSLMDISYVPHYLWNRDFQTAIKKPEMWEQTCNQTPFRLFSCLMHHGHNHRLVALNVLINNGLIQSGWSDSNKVIQHHDNYYFPSYISFGNSDRAWNFILKLLEKPNIPKEFTNILPYARHFFPDRVINASGSSREIAGEYYPECLFDIVVESTTQTSFFTEKTFKPLFYGKPFVILGAIGQNTILRDWGFETFDEYFDLSQDANPALRYKFHNWHDPDDWQIFSDHYEKLLDPLKDLNTHLSNTVNGRRDMERELEKIQSEVSEKCSHNQARLVEIMFDDHSIPPECWDTRKHLDKDSIVNIWTIGRTRAWIRSHPHFGKFVKVPKTIAEIYHENHRNARSN